MRAVVVAMLGVAALVAPATAAQAHLGEDDGFSLDATTSALGQSLSFLAAAGLTLAGFAYLRRRWGQGRRPDASWALVLFGIAWVVAAISVPAGWIDHLAWQLASAALILGTLGSAWWLVVRRRQAFWPWLRADRRALVAGAVAGIGFLGLFAFGTHMVIRPTAEEVVLAGQPEGYLITYQSFGPLAVWPDVEFWWPAANLEGHLTPASGAIALSAGALFGLAIALLVVNFSRDGLGAIGGAGAAPVATNFCACCTPALYPVLVALFGSGAAPLVYAMSDPDLALYNVSQVANLWLLAAAVGIGVHRLKAACAVPGAAPRAPAGTPDRPVP